MGDYKVHDHFYRNASVEDLRGLPELVDQHAFFKPAVQASSGEQGGVFELDDGLWYLPGCLSSSEQDELWRKASTEYPLQCGSQTNLGAATAAYSPKTRLRWLSLGVYYNWTLREYAPKAAYPLPAELGVLARRVIDCVGADKCNLRNLGEFQPDCALVNFYRAGDRLRGHRDDAENKLQQPMVTISLGAPAIFLVEKTNVTPAIAYINSKQRVREAGCQGSRPATNGDSPTTPDSGTTINPHTTNEGEATASSYHAIPFIGVHPIVVGPGDALILSGPSRCNLHGISRVLANQTQNERINISIRQCY